MAGNADGRKGGKAQRNGRRSISLFRLSTQTLDFLLLTLTLTLIVTSIFNPHIPPIRGIDSHDLLCNSSLNDLRLHVGGRLMPFSMAKFLWRQSPTAPHDSNNQDCMWNLLHFLNFNQRLHIKKMLVHKGHRGGKRTGRRRSPRTKQSNPSSCEEHVCLDKDAKLLIEDKADEVKAEAKQKSSGKALVRSLLLKGKPKEQDEMLNISSKSRLLRTSSMHHMESHGYSFSNELAFDSKSPAVDRHSCDIDSSTSREHALLPSKASDKPSLKKQCENCGAMNSMGKNQLDEFGNYLVENQLLLREKLTEANVTLSKQKDTHNEDTGDAVLCQQKEFLHMMELLNANRDLLLKILQDPNFMLTYQLQGQQAIDAGLTMSGSFPVRGSAKSKDNELDRLNKTESESFINQDGKVKDKKLASNPETNVLVEELRPSDDVGAMKSEIIMDNTGTVTSFKHLPGSQYEFRKDEDKGSVSSHFKLIKQSIKDAIKENREEHCRISMDGILHRIPYGQKVTDRKKEMQGLWEGSTSGRYGRNKSGSKFRISETISSSSKYTHKSMRRYHSLSESLDKYRQLLRPLSSTKSKRLPETSEARQENGLQETKSQKFLKRIFSLPEFDSCSLSKDLQDEAFSEDFSVEVQATSLAVGNSTANMYGSYEPKLAATPVHLEENIESDEVVEQIKQLHAGRTNQGGSVQPELIDVNNQWETCSISEYPTSEGSSNIDQHEQDYRNEEDLTLNSSTEENPVSHANYNLLEYPERNCTYFNELNCLNDSWSLPGDHVFDKLNCSERHFHGLHMPSELADVNIHVQVDEKDEPEFNYVRDILWKSGISGEGSFGAWYSPDQPVDPLLFEEAENSPREHEFSGDEPEISLDHQILFDLINEVLLDIYETYFSYCPWFSRFDSHIRPMPVGHHVLEEVWANISWHLHSQAQCDQIIDYIVVRDFTKNDKWMDLQIDTEDAAFDLEDLIMDDLLEEVIHEFADMSGNLCVPS